MSYKILLNADHSIHTKDNKIVTIPDSMALEDCECCGPPQPPPGCQRCIKYVNGEPVYYAPFEKDIAFVASNIPNTFTMSLTEHYSSKSRSSYNSNDPYGFCGCIESLFEKVYNFSLSGFAALNGTYYGVPTFNTAPIQPGNEPAVNPAGGLSTNPACNPGGIAFDPSIWIPSGFCNPPDPCLYSCNKTIYHLEVPITGTAVCTHKIIITCQANPSLNTNYIRTVTESINGYAYIYMRPDGPYTTSYGFTTAPAYDVVMSLTYTANAGYGNRYRDSFYRGWPKINTSCQPMDLPGYHDVGGCPFPPDLTPPDYSCRPEWKAILSGKADTCLESASGVPTFDEQFPACNYYNEDLFTDVLPCASGPGFIYRYIQYNHSATRQTGQIIWT